MGYDPLDPYKIVKGRGDKGKHEEFYFEVADWIDQQIEQALPYLPEAIAKVIAEYGVEAGLELTYVMTESYTPQYYFDEMKGISDASGIPYMDIVRINLFPELIKASCSMIGAWGGAIDTPNSLYQLRALDWATNGPFQKFASVNVYHPAAEGANSFANYGFLGFVGSLTGISSTPVGVCEKVWLSYNGTQNTFGTPWHFVMRDILQWDKTIDDAINRVEQATRTCSIFMGVGDIEHKFRGIEYSYDVVNIYDDSNYPLYENHPRMKGVVYINKHKQPSTDPCLANLLKAQYGSINASSLMQIAALHETGDTHAAVYDYGRRLLYVVVASPFQNGKEEPAFVRQWTELSLDALWAVSP